jgi:hypothetical protein
MDLDQPSDTHDVAYNLLLYAYFFVERSFI